MKISDIRPCLESTKEKFVSTKNYIQEAVKNPSMALSDFKDVLRKTSLEIVIGAVILGTAAGIGSSLYEARRDKNIQLAFSEITQVENDASYIGKKFLLQHILLDAQVMLL